MTAASPLRAKQHILVPLLRYTHLTRLEAQTLIRIDPANGNHGAVKTLFSSRDETMYYWSILDYNAVKLMQKVSL